MKKGMLANFTIRKDLPTAAPSVPEQLADEAAEAPKTGKLDDPRQRVVLRLHIDAIEALQDIARQRRREAGKSVSLQALMEEAVSDFFAKNGLVVEVKPAPAKQKR